jgi:hypothetical protein
MRFSDFIPFHFQNQSPTSYRQDTQNSRAMHQRVAELLHHSRQRLHTTNCEHLLKGIPPLAVWSLFPKIARSFENTVKQSVGHGAGIPTARTKTTRRARVQLPI